MQNSMKILGHVHHAGGIVHHDHAARAHDGAGFVERLIIHRHIQELLGGMHPPEGPPVCTALNLRPSGMPPPISKMISRSVMPMGTSISPVFCTRPASAKTFVPLLFSVPMRANQSPPLRRMGGMLANVSTLLIKVG